MRIEIEKDRDKLGKIERGQERLTERLRENERK